MQPILRMIPFFGLTALWLYPITEAGAQSVRPKASSSSLSRQSVTIENTEFRVHSATMANGFASTATVRVTLAVVNKGDKPIGAFIGAMHTSVATDTGIEILGNGEAMHTSGIGVCFAERETCIKYADKYIVSIPPTVTGRMILTFYRIPDQQSMRQALHRASAIDFAGVVFIRNADGNIGPYPLTFDDVALQQNNYR